MAAIQHDDNAIAAISEAKHIQSEEKRDMDLKSASDSEAELDGIHDGLEFPTEEEKLTLRRVADAIPWNAYCEWMLVSPYNISKSTSSDRYHRARGTFLSEHGYTLTRTHIVDPTSYVVLRLQRSICESRIHPISTI